MPFHSHSHSNINTNQNTAYGIYNAAGALGSIAAPNLQRLATGTTSAGTDSFLPSNEQRPRTHAGIGQSVPPLQTALPGQGSGAPMSAPTSGMNDAQQFNTPRRSQTIGRRPDDLQLSAQSAGQYQQQPQYQESYSANATPNIHLQQATPQGSQFTVPSQGNVPSQLQPGGSSRPGPSTAYTAPTTIPTMPQVQTNAQQYAPPSRSSTLHSSHSHSRSSPAGMDSQKYQAFSTTPSHAQTPTSSSTKYHNTSQTPTTSHSPLGLADIRSRAVSDVNNEGLFGSGATFSEFATNSNYLAPFPTYAYDWCKWPVHGGSSGGKMAVGSYLEDPHNFIQILDTQITPQEVTAPGQSGYGLEFHKVAEATCAYPVTRILWEPPSSQKQSTDLLATSGDHLRLWSLPQSSTPQLSSNINRSSSVNSRDQPPQKLQPLALLSNSKTPEHTAPLTSLDWNTLSPKLIITSSIDTTCTIWDIPTLTAKTQLIAHDKEVFDVRFCAGSVDVFVSCGADGSVRMFDLRSLEHSTIIYEPAEKNDKEKGSSPSASSPTKPNQTLTPAPPLLRLAASPHDAHLLATFASDSNLIRILDVRQPGTALLELRGHTGALNTLEWNPSRRGMLASGADDSLVLVWDLLNSSNAAPAPATVNGGPVAEVQGKGPSASWRCEYEVGNVSWAPQSGLTSQGGDWLGVCAGRGVWGVKL